MTNDEIVSGFNDITDEYLGIRLQQIEEIPNGLVLRMEGFITNTERCVEYIDKVIEAGYGN